MSNEQKASAVDEMTTLGALTAEVVLSDGTKVEAHPLMFMEVIRATKIVTPVIRAIEQMEAPREATSNGAIIALLLESAPEAMIAIASMSVRKSADWFEGLAADDGFKVLIGVYEVNKSFFVQRLLPLIPAEVRARLVARAAKLGV